MLSPVVPLPSPSILSSPAPPSFPLSSLLQEMLDEADKDGDGEVSEAEFLRIMKKTNMY